MLGSSKLPDKPHSELTHPPGVATLDVYEKDLYHSDRVTHSGCGHGLQKEHHRAPCRVGQGQAVGF